MVFVFDLPTELWARFQRNMAKYYEEYRFLIVATTLTGMYFQPIEKIYGHKWYIKFLKALIFFPAVGLPSLLAFSCKFVFFDEANIVKKVYGIVQCVYAFFSAYIICSFYYNKNDIEAAFELWDSLFQEELYPEDRKELLEKNKKIANWWLKSFGSFSLISVVLYSFMQFSSPAKRLDHPSGVPYRHQTPDFELVVIYELLLGIYGFAMLTCFDSITLVLLTLEEAQFLHLKRSLARIIEVLAISDSGELFIHADSNLNGYTDKGLLDPRMTRVADETFAEVERKIRIWVKHHNQVLRFHKELFKIYNSVFSTKFLLFIVIICLCSFLMVSEGGFSMKDAIFAVCFCASNYTLFYKVIQFADSIKDTANFIFEEAFGRAWHFFPNKFKTVFKIILLRSKCPVIYKPLQVYPLSSKSFLKIISSGYSVFTFLLHISSKEK